MSESGQRERQSGKSLIKRRRIPGWYLTTALIVSHSSGLFVLSGSIYSISLAHVSSRLISFPIFSARLIMLERAIAIKAILSVRLSVRHTRDTHRLKPIEIRFSVLTVRQSDVSSFLTANFVVLSLGVHPMC